MADKQSLVPVHKYSGSIPLTTVPANKQDEYDWHEPATFTFWADLEVVIPRGDLGGTFAALALECAGHPGSRVYVAADDIPAVLTHFDFAGGKVTGEWAVRPYRKGFSLIPLDLAKVYYDTDGSKTPIGTPISSSVQ